MIRRGRYGKALLLASYLSIIAIQPSLFRPFILFAYGTASIGLIALSFDWNFNAIPATSNAFLLSSLQSHGSDPRPSRLTWPSAAVINAYDIGDATLSSETF